MQTKHLLWGALAATFCAVSAALSQPDLLGHALALLSSPGDLAGLILAAVPPVLTPTAQAASEFGRKAKGPGDGEDDDPVEIAKEMKRVNESLKEFAEEAKAAIKKAKDLSADTKEKVDELLIKQGELQAQITAMEQKAARRGGTAGNDGGDGMKSPGQEVVESEEFKKYLEQGNFKNRFTLQLKAVTNITSLTTGTGAGGAAIAPDRLNVLVTPPERRMTVRDLLTPGRTSSNLIQYVKETGFQNMAATVAEGAAKPKSDLAFDLVASAVVKIATYVKASTEILQDAPMLQSYIDGRLRYMLAYVEEGQLLNGSGVGNNLNGIYTQATAYSAPIVVTSPTRIDVLRLALLQAELALFPPTGIVLHPADWAAIELTKDTTGAYIFANPQGLATPMLWRRPVVETQAMTMDTFLVGAFKLGAQIFDRMQSSVTVATENEDDFIKNLVTILAEERVGLAVYRPESFVKGDLTP